MLRLINEHLLMSKMDAADAANDMCRLYRESSSLWKTRHSRYLLLLLMMTICSCWMRVSATAEHHSKTVTKAASDAVVWTPSALTNKGASLSQVADRLWENAGRGWLASLPRRNHSSARDRDVDANWRALIAVHRPVVPHGADRPGRLVAAPTRHRVVNNVKPSATTTTMTAGVTPPPAAERVNVAPVITTPRGRYDRPSRILIRSTSSHSQSYFNTVVHALGILFHHLANILHSLTSSPSLIADSAAATSVKQNSNAVQPNLTHSSPDNKYAASIAMGGINTVWNIYENYAALKRDGSRKVRRSRRHSEVESADKVDEETTRSESGELLNTPPTLISGTSMENSTITTEAGSVGVPLGASALRYRSRGNFAALVDPMNNGRRRSSASARSLSAGKCCQPGTASDNLASQSQASDETTVSSASSAFNISLDSDSVEVKVLMKIDLNSSADAENSASVSIQTLHDIMQLNSSKNSTVAPSGESNCSKAMKSISLQAALKLQMSDSAAAVSIYTLSFLFAVVAAWAITSVIFSLCIRNQCSSHFAADRQPLSSQMVLGFVAMAAAARALYYVAAEYPLFASVLPSSGRRAIYECWFPFAMAAFFVHRQLLYSNVAVTQENNIISTDKGNNIARSRFRRDVCVFYFLFSCYLMLVFSLCLLIEFCVVPVEAVFVLRFAFALFAIFLSAANIHKVATSFSCYIETQVALCVLVLICAGFSAVDAATLLSNDFALLVQQNANVSIACEAANRLAELFILIVLCANSWSIFSKFKCEKSRTSKDFGQNEVSGTKANEIKVVSYPQASMLFKSSPATHLSWLTRLLDKTSNKSKVVDAGPPQLPMDAVQAVGWALTENLDAVTPLPPPSRMTRSRSMLYNDHGFIRFRLDGDTDGESDARTLDDDDGMPGDARSVPASEYASADNLSFRRGPSSTGTPRWSRSGSPSLTGFRAPSIHLQDSIDRALDRCDIWRVGQEQGQLGVEELRRIVQLYADFGDGRRGNQYHHRRTVGMTSINFAEV